LGLVGAEHYNVRHPSINSLKAIEATTVNTDVDN